MVKSEKSLEMILRFVTAMLILFWLFTQVVTIIAIEVGYHSILNEYSQLFKENLGDRLNSSWAVAVKYKNGFDGTYGEK
jgi:predicted membrane protein